MGRIIVPVDKRTLAALLNLNEGQRVTEIHYDITSGCLQFAVEGGDLPEGDPLGLSPVYYPQIIHRRENDRTFISLNLPQAFYETMDETICRINQELKVK